jgi:hypothetical protein
MHFKQIKEKWIYTSQWTNQVVEHSSRLRRPAGEAHVVAVAALVIGAGMKAPLYVATVRRRPEPLLSLDLSVSHHHPAAAIGGEGEGGSRLG